MSGRATVTAYAGERGYTEEHHDDQHITFVRGTYRVWVKFSKAGAVVAATGNHGPWVLNGRESDKAAKLLRLM